MKLPTGLKADITLNVKEFLQEKEHANEIELYSKRQELITKILGLANNEISQPPTPSKLSSSSQATYTTKQGLVTVVALEVAKDDKVTKIIQDSAKLLREAKDDIDNLIDILPTSYDEVFTWSFQISGVFCYISTSHIASDGLYVSIPQCSFHLPMIAATQPLLEFKKTLEFLFEYKNHIVDMVAIINQNNIKRNSIDDKFGLFSQNSSRRRDISPWTCDTWYTPHRNEGESSVIPSHLFGWRQPASFLEKNLLLSSGNEADNANSSGPEDNGDKYGFIKTPSGWYNKYTKKTHESHPLQDI
ncbi:hypothetical protein BD770DRAFT_445043 [Pilaira anomala]|nr:hypothetical protein BD770DRAFT_445043 [Pilaira anomala]